MGLFTNQLSNVIEWEENREDVLFWKWSNKEIKKGSRLIIRPGQDAIFLYNGKIEGVFSDEGNFEVESQIIPFLSTLKGFKFGFNSGIRAEVLFINTKEITVPWGTKSPILIPSPSMPSGVPIRSFGTFSIKVSEYETLISKVAGVKETFTVDEVKERVVGILDQTLMKWIVKEGKDIFNLQSNAVDIGNGVKKDIDMELFKIGLSITDFKVSSFNYPEEIQKMIEKNVAYNMVSDVDKFQRIGMVEAITNNKGGSNDAMNSGMGMAMGMKMVNEMSNNNQNNNQTGTVGKFCSNCGIKGEGNFCKECGSKL